MSILNLNEKNYTISELRNLLDINVPYTEEDIVESADKIKNNEVISSWKDAYASSGLTNSISDFIEVPTFGCFKDERKQEVEDVNQCIQKIWSIGGKTGWYSGNWLWRLRGYFDKLVGGVGLRRGRTNPDSIYAGDALDFWRVLYANKEEGRLLLFAEMKLPGEAWLEFKIEKGVLIQTATFRPLGLLGRAYWYAVFPFHGFIFKGMIRNIASKTIK